MKKNNKTKIIVSVSLAAVATATIPVGIVNLVNASHSQNNKKYELFSKTFNSKNDAINFVKNQAKIDNSFVDVPKKWSLDINGNTVMFNSPKEVVDFLDKQINQSYYSTNKKDFSLNVDNSLIPSDINYLKFNNSEPVQIFRGKNNSIHLTEKQAKESYYSVHDAYYYDGLFFRTKEELAVYLQNKFDNITTPKKINSFSLKNKNNEISLPITVDELTKINDKNSKAYRYISDFVDNNTTAYFKLINSANKVNYYDKSNLESCISSYKPNFVKLSSNQGKGNWVVDLDKSDPYDLLGPYYVKSDSTITEMKNPSRWEKIDGNDHKFVESTIKAQKTISFFGTIIPPTTSENSNLIFDIPELNQEINSYFNILKSEFKEIYNSIYSLFSTMRKGKRYSEFLKIPILFSHTIDKLVKYNAQQKYIDLTRKIYSKITNYLDNTLRYVIPKELSLSLGKEEFSFTSLFGILNQSFDLNSDLESLALRIEAEFKELYKSIDFFSNASILLEKLPFLDKEDFYPELFETIFNFKIDSKNYNSYKLIWNCLTSNSIEELEQNMLNINSTWNNNQTRLTIKQIQDNIPPIFAETFINRNIENKIIKLSYDNYFKKSNFLNNDQKNVLKTMANFEYGLNLDNINFLKELYKNNNSIDSKTISILRLIAINNCSLKNIFNNIPINSINFKKELIKQLNLIYQRNNFFDTRFSNIFSFPLRTFLSISKEYINIPNKIDYSSYISNYFSDLMSQKAQSFQQVLTQIKTKIDYRNEILGSTVDLLDGLSKICESSMKLLSVMSSTFFFVSLALDVLINFYKVNYYSYVFESEDVKYIWNGGKEESFFFGLIPGKKIGIEDMKLLEPKEVVSMNFENSYYYNSKRYDTEDEMKLVQLNDILEDKYTNEFNMQKVYSLLNLNKNPNASEEYIANSIEELKTKTINHVIEYSKNPITPQGNLGSEILVLDSYKFSDNSTYIEGASTKTNIENIINNIKPILLVQTPKLIQKNSKFANTPIYNDANNNEDNSISNYKLPYYSWQNGNVSYNLDKNFLIVDPNLKNKTLTPKQTRDILWNNFSNSFEVQSKFIDKKFLNTTTVYSDLSENTNKGILYTAKNFRSEEKYFLNKLDAQRWLFNQYKFKAHYVNQQFETIKLGNLTFNSYLEFLNWVESQIKEI